MGRGREREERKDGVSLGLEWSEGLGEVKKMAW